MTNRETLVQLRVKLVNRRCDAASEVVTTSHPEYRLVGGLTEAIRILDAELATIPELVYEPSPDMDAGGAG